MPCPSADSPLRRFISLPKETLLVLGPRRIPPTANGAKNSYTSLTISTSVGNRNLEVSAYIQAMAKLKPDAIVAAVDIEAGDAAPGLRRREKMTERSVAWMRGIQRGLSKLKEEGLHAPALWTPILPLEAELQRSYLEHLEESSDLEGLVVYDKASILDIPASMKRLPCISFSPSPSPHDILHQIQLGADLLAIPFITAASEAGIAFTFSFPPPQPLSTPSTPPTQTPLGTDLWSPSHATDTSPLQVGCTCYACMSHHRAYITHLLSAKEMLAWVLLQLHNHHAMDNFFRGVRTSIARGSFETDVQKFGEKYEPAFPEFTGQGPRYVPQLMKPVRPR